MQHDNAALPLFAQVRDQLRAGITAGTLAPGTKLPTEAELEKQYGVSRITVRQALSQLQAEQLIEKVNGKGSFVRAPDKPPPDMGPLSGFYETLRRRGHATSGTVSEIRRIPADATVAGALRLPEGAPVATLTITRQVDDEVHAFQHCYGSNGLLEALVAEDLAQNDLLTVLRTRLHYPVVRSHMDIEAINATPALAKRLQVRADSALLRIQITSHDAADSPIMFNAFFARGDRFRYRMSTKA